MSARFERTANYTWTNEHNNITKRVLNMYRAFNRRGTAWKDGLSAIQDVIADVAQRRERLRSYGAKWSLSDVAVCNDSILDSKPLAYLGTIRSTDLAGRPLYPNDPLDVGKRLFYIQAGVQISSINSILEGKGVCLPTTGASNGQTIAGAVSTGVHGSALKIGSMQDFVRAIHLVTSKTDHCILQPATNPVVKQSFSDIFGAKLISDDRLFESALVSFGGFGIIHGVIVETVPLFQLETYCLLIDYDRGEEVFPALANFDHARDDNLAGFLGRFNLPDDQDPHHFEFIVNPYSTRRNAFLRVMYKRTYDPAKLDPRVLSTSRVGDSVLSLVGDITSTAGDLVPVIVNAFFGRVAREQSGYTQTPRNIFGDTVLNRPRNGAISAELGVSIADARTSIRHIIGAAQQSNFAGVLGIRFVRRSKATLAFTRFDPLTCTIELPGLRSDSMHRFYDTVFRTMDDARIRFTLHWGQYGDYSPARLSAMYSSDVEKWLEDRSRILPDPFQRYMFTNDFMKRCGLSEGIEVVDGGEIS